MEEMIPPQKTTVSCQINNRHYLSKKLIINEIRHQ